MTDRERTDEAEYVPSDAELRRLLAQAKAAGDEPLRRMIVSYLSLRRVTADVVAYLETRDGAGQVARIPLLAQAKRLATGTRTGADGGRRTPASPPQ
jgi:hypothetical protein